MTKGQRPAFKQYLNGSGDWTAYMYGMLGRLSPLSIYSSGENYLKISVLVFVYSDVFMKQTMKYCVEQSKLITQHLLFLYLRYFLPVM